MSAPPAVTLELLQWLLTGAAIVLVALFGWIARRLDRLDQQHRQATERAEDRLDNDIRDLWQALDAHRQETRQTAQIAQQSRDRIIQQLHAIELRLSHFAAPPEPPPCAPAPPTSA